ncbi:MAG: segregation/condensation protein A [Clostridia bacterium]
MAKFINSSLEDVKFHLDNQAFDGPIDLLVQMVKESEIDIMEIFVSDITKQYMSYVVNMKDLDYEYVSEYIILAATLIEIKASKLLPDYLADDDELSEIQLTQSNLIGEIEKAMLLAMPDKLEPMELHNLFYREPMYEDDDYKLVVNDFSYDKLIDAFKDVLEKAEFESVESFQPKTITKERFSVADQIKEIASRIRTEDKVDFYDLFDKNYTKLETINTFLAILELVKMQIACAEQDNITKNIFIMHNKEDKMEDIQSAEVLLKNVDTYN